MTAAALLVGSVRNRQSLFESLSDSLLSAKSKAKPPLSTLHKSPDGPRGRAARMVAAVCATVTAICVLAFYCANGARPALRRGGTRVTPAAPSLADYPKVLVAESAPFKEVSGNVDGRGAGAPARSVGPGFGTRVPTESEAVTPVGMSNAGGAPALRIIVLTMDREASLRRLLASLRVAEYGDDRVDLDIWIDRPSKSDGADETMAAMVSACTRDFRWTQGVRTVHRRLENAGLYEQWIYTWNVTEDSTEAAVILEDDLEVSPHFYTWLKQARQAYSSDPSVAAFTLQRGELRPRQVPGVASGKLRVDESRPVFKYRLLGTWGFAPEKGAWLEFRAWYEEMRRVGARPYVDNLVTTSWYKAQEKGGTVARTMWSQWFIKFSDVNGYFTVYSNIAGGSTLASNYREGGMHYSDKPRRADFPVFKGSPAELSFPASPVYLDWDGRELPNRPSAPFHFRRPPV
jgi:hypothetical protein